jgi:putative tricarboxylic transport membrane protein
MYRLGSVVPLLIGLFFAYQAYALSLGQMMNPGPGLWPFIVCVGMIIAAVAVLIAERVPKHFEKFTSYAWQTLYGIISILLFIMLFTWIGFILPSMGLLFFWLRFMGKETWRMSVVLSILITMAFYLLFQVGLHVPFPDDLILSPFR